MSSAYYCAPSLLTEAEMKFYRVLLTIVDREEEQLMVKVRLADLAHVDKDRFPDGTPEEHHAFRYIAWYHVDFVWCERATLKPLLAIELDDQSHHTNPRQIASDARKEQVLEHVGLPLLRWPYQVMYTRHELEAAIRAAVPALSAVG
jgi:hypothetical protein